MPQLVVTIVIVAVVFCARMAPVLAELDQLIDYTRVSSGLDDARAMPPPVDDRQVHATLYIAPSTIGRSVPPCIYVHMGPCVYLHPSVQHPWCVRAHAFVCACVRACMRAGCTSCGPFGSRVAYGMLPLFCM